MAEAMKGCDASCCGEGLPRQVALRELGRFSQSWRWGKLIEPAPGERLSRRRMDARLVERARADPEFLDDLRRHPHWVYMVAAFDCFGISKLRFIEQVREVRLLEEEPDLLYLVLPARARLQAELETAAGPNGFASEAGAASERERVEELLVARAESDGAFRDALLFRPEATYRTAARDAAGGSEPEYLQGVREVRVVPESQDSLALVLPAAER